MSEKFREVGKRKSTTSTDKFKCDRCYKIAAEFDSFLLRSSTLAQDRDRLIAIHYLLEQTQREISVMLLEK
ncbi:hypothetical protein [Nostoc sp.]|uniref:hypothetical protein n=1 Tax=Nostoc sp. TaxID=1180 RepID=UPI003593B522